MTGTVKLKKINSFWIPSKAGEGWVSLPIENGKMKYWSIIILNN